MREVNYLRGLTKEEFSKVMKDCIDKMEGLNDLDWQDIVDKYNLDIHRDVLRKSFSAPIGGYSVYKYLSEEKVNSIEDEELLTKYEEKEIAFKEERVRLNDIRRKLNTMIRESARYKNNVELLKDSIERLNEESPMIFENTIRIDGNNEAVLCLSDIHIGIKIDNYFNSYNINIAKERMNKLANSVIEKCRLHKVNKIHILVNGDLISGNIHKSLVADADISLIDSITKGSEIISSTIALISSQINWVEVYFAIGNHSRINPNKKENLEKDNFEYLMFDFIKLRLANNSNIHFNENTYHDNIINFKIFDKQIIAMHGDSDKPTSVAKNITQFLGVKPYKIYLGHYHSYQSFDCNGTHVTVNGSVVSTDSYAFSLRLSSEPYQVLTIYDSNTKQEECEYKIKLNNK